MRSPGCSGCDAAGQCALRRCGSARAARHARTAGSSRGWLAQVLGGLREQYDMREQQGAAAAGWRRWVRCDRLAARGAMLLGDLRRCWAVCESSTTCENSREQRGACSGGLAQVGAVRSPGCSGCDAAGQCALRRWAVCESSTTCENSGDALRCWAVCEGCVGLDLGLGLGWARARAGLG